MHEPSASRSPAEGSPFRSGSLVRPARVSPSARRRTRKMADSAGWGFERRRGCVRPLRHLRCGAECAVADLGECGDRKCGNYRLNEATCDVRPSFLDFCVHHIQRAIPRAELRAGIVYCSLGSGQLLFDWELLERLTLKEGVRLREVHLIDKDYGGPKRRRSAVRALRLLAGWYGGEPGDEFPPPFRSFLSAPDYERWAKRAGQLAHVLLDCDAVGARKRIDVASFRDSVLRPGGVCLVLSNPAKRTAIQKSARSGSGGGGGGLRTLVQHVYRRGEWRHLESVSNSRTRSRRRRRRETRASRSGRRPPAGAAGGCCRCCGCSGAQGAQRGRSRSRPRPGGRGGDSRDRPRADSRD